MNICPQCGGRLLPKATNCPHCNKFIQHEAASKDVGIPKGLIQLLLVVLIGGALLVTAYTFVQGRSHVAGGETLAPQFGSSNTTTNPDGTMTTRVCMDNEAQAQQARAGGAREIPSDTPGHWCFEETTPQ